jgi:hypothetical protein
VRTKLSDVAGIIRVAIVLMPERLERGIGSKTLDRHREREKKDDWKNPSDYPMHTRMISRGRALGCASPTASVHTCERTELGADTGPVPRALTRFRAIR